MKALSRVMAVVKLTCQEVNKSTNTSDTDLVFYWIAAVLFLGFLVLVRDVKVLHVGCEG